MRTTAPGTARSPATAPGDHEITIGPAAGRHRSPVALLTAAYELADIRCHKPAYLAKSGKLRRRQLRPIDPSVRMEPNNHPPET
ncbi:hypothetical protein Sme01_64370 [Sphaerisporangium melleum]|uniref:Uncharacterized protein n=1 Tax=Sphaerisporangium melleum TaxID=321316 RepID=A0A917RFM7_9ACTN|nr:hypothetical protein GCM10007964_53830 [Sphaerisporangium melleum]GII73961.1 hypothetical protein Sme01_64370 [Sphaerisporangium melleum]